MNSHIVKLILCAIIALSFVSCNTKEKKATECLETRLKCPSSLNVVSVEKEKRDAIVIYDTIYHVNEIYGQTFEYMDDVYETADSIRIDSICIVKHMYPASTLYTITYDADNLMGAHVRNTSYVIEDHSDNTFLMDDEFAIKYMHDHEYDYRAKTMLIYIKTWNIFLRSNTWISSFDFTSIQ